MDDGEIAVWGLFSHISEGRRQWPRFLEFEIHAAADVWMNASRCNKRAGRSWANKKALMTIARQALSRGLAHKLNQEKRNAMNGGQKLPRGATEDITPSTSSSIVQGHQCRPADLQNR